MKAIEKRKKTKKYLIVAAICVVVVLLSAAIYVFAFKGSIFGWPNRPPADNSSINYDEPTEEQINAGRNIQKDSPNNSSEHSNETPGDHSDSKDTVDMIISASNQTDATFQVRSLISAVTDSGTCTLTLTKSDQTVRKTAEVQASASTSTCKGFDIPMAELSPGSWQLSLHFENDQLTADVVQDVEIK